MFSLSNSFESNRKLRNNKIIFILHQNILPKNLSEKQWKFWCIKYIGNHNFSCIWTVDHQSYLIKDKLSDWTPTDWNIFITKMLLLFAGCFTPSFYTCLMLVTLLLNIWNWYNGGFLMPLLVTWHNLWFNGILGELAFLFMFSRVEEKFNSSLNYF